MAITKEQRLANLAKAREVSARNRKARAAAKKQQPKQVEQDVLQPGAGEYEDDEGLLFDVEAAPEGLIDPPADESAISKVLRKIGLKGNASANDEPAPRASFSPKLNKHQQSLYDSFAPLAIQGFILVAGWTWARMGEDYQALAPDEQTSTRIIGPLMRIYARTSKIGTELNPNHADAAASMAALIGYVWTSYGLYKQIRAEKEEAYNDGYQHIAAADNVRPIGQSENRPSYADPGRGVNGAGDGNGRAASRSNGPTQPGVDLSKLSEAERAAYEKLSRLSALDYASRARRSGLA